tara:strand:- start:4601 stop:5590 length:990 start_codon:yes stop_codon:yes gene_type:complete
MNILVTGGAGYIGSHTCLNLLDAGHNITVIDNLSRGYKKIIPKKANFIKTNINDKYKINKLLQNNAFDAVIHFAGYIQVEESIKYPKKYFINNTNNALIFFKTCIKNGIKNIIFSSTAAVYGNPKKTLINENSSLIPLNPYGKSKLKTEKILMQLKKKYKINYMILRYFNVAGADNKMRSGLISKKSTHLIKIATEAVVGKRKSISIFGTDYNTFDGTGIRDYIHVSDLADIHLKSLEYLLKTKNSTIMNCGYGKGYSVKEVLDYMNKICNGKLKINHKNRRIGDATSLVADIKKLKKTIKWKPKYNDLNIILKTALKWEKKLRNEKIL